MTVDLQSLIQQQIIDIHSIHSKIDEVNSLLEKENSFTPYEKQNTPEMTSNVLQSLYTPVTPLGQQQLSLTLKDRSLEDLLHVLSSCRTHSMEIRDYLRIVRQIARDQFLIRAHSLKILRIQRETFELERERR